MTWADLAWVWCFGFWIGFGWRDHAYKRAARIPTLEERVGRLLLGSVKELDDARKWTGPGLSLTYEADLTIKGAKYRFQLRDQVSVPHETSAPPGPAT